MLAREPLSVGLLRALVACAPRAAAAVLVGEHAEPAAPRLAQPPDGEREPERRQREDDERGPPRKRGDVAGDGEAETGADVLAGEDEAVDPAALPAPNQSPTSDATTVLPQR